MQISSSIDRWPLKGTFTISRGSRTESEVVTVRIEDTEQIRGWAECTPYARYGETCDSVVEQIDSFKGRYANSVEIDRTLVAKSLPAGAARNALDCALWDLQAKRSKRRVWDILGMAQPAPVVTAYTLSLDTPAAMGQQARENQHRPLLKIKLGPKGATERIDAIRTEATASRLIVDANEAWSLADLEQAMPALEAANVILIEQPLPAGNDFALKNFNSPIPIAADESCHTLDDLEHVVEHYDVANIKLDKTGGLTEALALKQAAAERGLGIMVGCMMSTSLAMAPATLLTESAMVVDLDGPLWLAKDRDTPLSYENHHVFAPERALWG